MLLESMFKVATIGFLVGWVGMYTGMISSSLLKDKALRIQGTLFGMAAGVILAIICFDLIPEGIETSNVYVTMIGVLAGVYFASILDGITSRLISKNESKKTNKYLSTAIFMSVAMAIHNLPEGIALGTMLSKNFQEGLGLAFILAIHCIPEGLAIGELYRRGNTSALKILILSIFTALPMAIGSTLGWYFSSISTLFASLSFSFSAGLMLYITTGELLPESKHIWGGRLTTIGISSGVLIGMYLTLILG